MSDIPKLTRKMDRAEALFRAGLPGHGVVLRPALEEAQREATPPAEAPVATPAPEPTPRSWGRKRRKR